MSTVISDFRLAWKRKSVVFPIYVASRLIGVAIVAPAVSALLAAALLLSGQSALTDQDIARFLLSPVGFLAGLFTLAVLFAGSALGFAVLSFDVRHGRPGAVSALRLALGGILSRLPQVIGFAMLLTLRVLAYVVPFAVAGLVTARALIGTYDINFYLSARPPEFLLFIGIAAILLILLAIVLVPRLLGWSVSLHAVLFGGVSPGAAFADSRARMTGQRLALVKDVALWLAVRTALMLIIGFVFVTLADAIPALLGLGFRAALTVFLALAGVWILCNMMVAATALGALARVLDRRYDGTVAEPSGTRDFGTSPKLLAGGLIVLLVVGFAMGGRLLSRVDGDQTVEVIAHRGAAGTRPENTLASINRAAEIGADWVEIDVQETADGEVVVVHDSDFMKMAGNPLKIWDATMADLESIDIGSWYDAAYADERTPTLVQALEAVRGRTNLLIELKYYGHDVDLEARTAAIVDELGMADQVAVMSLKYPAVEKMIDLRPDWRTGVLAATAVGDLTRLDGDFIAVSSAQAGPKLARAAAEEGKDLYVWTVNDPVSMSSAISMGADGLITDFPELAQEVIAARVDMTAPERLALVLAERFGVTFSDNPDGDP
ncbi:MAG: glycerophosphodiester phosphodiesterase family protein [Pseudomonadota bacterium]